MKYAMLLVLSATLATTACSPGSTGGSQGAKVSPAECEQFYDKHLQFADIDPSVASMMRENIASDCQNFDPVSRQDFQCAMQAGSVDEYAACNVRIHADRRR